MFSRGRGGAGRSDRAAISGATRGMKSFWNCTRETLFPKQLKSRARTDA